MAHPGNSGVPTLEIAGEIRPTDLRAVLPELVGAIPHEYIRACRWFGSKSRQIRAFTMLDAALLSEEPLIFLVLLETSYVDGAPELYQLPLAMTEERGGAKSTNLAPLGYVQAGTRRLIAHDAFELPEFALLLFELTKRSAEISSSYGRVVFDGSDRLRHGPRVSQSRVLGGEQSNTSVMYDATWMMKCYRRLAFGPNRDLEVARFFSEYTDFRYTPMPVGSIEYIAKSGERATLAGFQDYVANEGDGWSYVLGRLSATFGSGAGGGNAESSEGRLHRDLYRLGEVTGQMHSALGSRPDLPAFAPEMAAPADKSEWVRDLESQAARAFQGIETAVGTGAAPDAEQLGDFLARREQYEKALRSLGRELASVTAWRIQIHGDYHLGQVLKTADGFVVIDFEGEPARPLEERRAKQSPLRDVAGMLRSLNYASVAAVQEASRAEGSASSKALAARWEEAAARAYEDGYRAATAQSGLLPDAEEDRRRLLTFFQVAKAFYELNYELNNRPGWVRIPLAGISRLMETL